MMCDRIYPSYESRWILEILENAHKIVNFLEDKKAERILLLDIHELTTLADFFIICNGTSERMLQALASSLREFVKKEFSTSVRIEGESRDGWMLADINDIVVHFFSPDQREYYNLEKLWENGKLLVSLQ